MADDTPDVSDEALQDVSLIDTPIAAAVQAAPSTTEQTPKDQGSETPDTPTTDKAVEAEDTPATEPETQTDEQTKGQPDPDKAHQAYLNRQQQRTYQTKQNIAQQLDQNYGPPSQEQLEAQGLTPDQAQIQALREEIAYKEQRTYVAELNAGLQAEAINVTNDYKVYDPTASDYDQEFTLKVEQLYKTAARLQVDDNGIVTNAEVPLYDFYQEMASIYSRGTSKGSQQGTKEALQMLSRTEDAVGGSSSLNSGSETLEDMEERLGGLVIT